MLAQSSLFTVGGTFPVGSGAASSGVASAEMVTADFNRDGKADLAILNTNDRTITLLFGDGTGKFTQAPSGPISAPYTYAIATADFNGDGIPDVALSSGQVLLGDGTGAFTKAAGATGEIISVSGATS